MNERHIQLEEPRESYSAPTYNVYSFEVSDLIQTSGDFTSAAYLGSCKNSSTAELTDW